MALAYPWQSHRLLLIQESGAKSWNAGEMGSYRVPRTVSKFLWHLSFISRGRGATQQKIGCFVIEPRFWLLADQKPIIREASFPGGASGKERTFQSKRQIRKIPWRRKCQATPVFLSGESHGERSLVQATVHGVAKSRLKRLSTNKQHKVSRKEK